MTRAYSVIEIWSGFVFHKLSSTAQQVCIIFRTLCSPCCYLPLPHTWINCYLNSWAPSAWIFYLFHEHISLIWLCHWTAHLPLLFSFGFCLFFSCSFFKQESHPPATISFLNGDFFLYHLQDQWSIYVSFYFFVLAKNGTSVLSHPIVTD